MKKFKHYKNITKYKSGAGFTLIELMVSISIVSVIMTVVLFTYSSFNDSLALSAAGQEVASAVRQAQTYGLSVKEFSVGSEQFTSGYGIYFDPVSDPTNYYIFVDIIIGRVANRVKVNTIARCKLFASYGEFFNRQAISLGLSHGACHFLSCGREC